MNYKFYITLVKMIKMNEAEVKAKIGEHNWTQFCQWMRGQTIGINKDGSTDYYLSDVDRFQRYVKKK
jgi:NOL1/NOP2/fmu family ribosome biogenesis protein